MAERDKSHDEELTRWANYVRENPNEWKSKLKPFLDSQIIIARRARKKMKEKMLKSFFVSIVIFFLLVGTFSFVFSANIDDLGRKIEEGGKKLEETQKNIERMTKEDYKWEMLSKGWKEIFLRNKAIAFLDEIFKKGNIVFVVLFGRDYSLSLTLLFLIIMWLYAWNQLYKIFSCFTLKSNTIALAFSFLLTIILTHLGLFDELSKLLFKFIFYRSGVWGWIWYIISVGIIIIVSLAISNIFSVFKIRYKKILKNLRDEEMKNEVKRSSLGWKTIFKIFGKT